MEVVSDSELMVKQMRGEYKIKNAALRELSLEAARLARALGAVTYTAVRREHNKLADQLVNDALDEDWRRLNPRSVDTTDGSFDRQRTPYRGRRRPGRLAAALIPEDRLSRLR